MPLKFAWVVIISLSKVFAIHHHEFFNPYSSSILQPPAVGFQHLLWIKTYPLKIITDHLPTKCNSTPPPKVPFLPSLISANGVTGSLLSPGNMQTKRNKTSFLQEKSQRAGGPPKSESFKEQITRVRRLACTFQVERTEKHGAEGQSRETEMIAVCWREGTGC